MLFALALEPEGYKPLLFLARLYPIPQLVRRVVHLPTSREMIGTSMTCFTAPGDKLEILAVIGGAQTRDEENICMVTNDA